MLAAYTERKEQGVEVVYGAKGSVVEIRGLADALSAARMRSQDEGEPSTTRTIGDWQDCGEGKGADCLAERIRKARERVERMQGLDSTR